MRGLGATVAPIVDLPVFRASGHFLIPTAPLIYEDIKQNRYTMQQIEPIARESCENEQGRI